MSNSKLMQTSRLYNNDPTRSQSCPLLLRAESHPVHAQIQPTNVESPIPRRNPWTLGIPGSSSPTAYCSLGTLHKDLCACPIAIEPKLKIEVWHETLYCMVDYHPVIDDAFGMRRGMMRPELWHSTIFRAQFSRGSSKQQHEMAAHLLRDMRHIWKALPIPGTLAVSRHPAWKKSWNFAVDSSWANILQVLRSSFSLFLAEADPDAVIQTFREFHVSWH